MPRYVATAKTYTNPFSSHRLVDGLLPCLDEEPYFPPSHRVNFRERYQTITVVIAEKPIGALALYRDYHREMLRYLFTIADKVLFFTAGVIPDRTDPEIGYPQKLGMDPIGERNRLYAEIPKMLKDLAEEFSRIGKQFPVDSFRFIPVGPVIYPCAVNQNFGVRHFAPAAIDAANMKAEHDERKPFGDTNRPLEEGGFRKGNYLFSPAYFDARAALEILFKDESGTVDEEVRLATLFNRYVLANAFARVLDVIYGSRKFGYDERDPRSVVHMFDQEGSSATDVMRIAVRILQEKYGRDIGFDLKTFEGVMRNTDRPLEGVCTKEALSVLKGSLYNIGLNFATVR